MGNYTGLAGGKSQALSINSTRKTRAAQREYNRKQPKLPGTGNF